MIHTISPTGLVGLTLKQAPKAVGDLLKVIMADLDSYMGELGQEMRAIADYMEVDLGIVVTLNFAYELRRVSKQCLWLSLHAKIL